MSYSFGALHRHPYGSYSGHFAQEKQQKKSHVQATAASF